MHQVLSLGELHASPAGQRALYMSEVRALAELHAHSSVTTEAALLDMIKEHLH